MSNLVAFLVSYFLLFSFIFLLKVLLENESLCNRSAHFPEEHKQAAHYFSWLSHSITAEAHSGAGSFQ